MKKYQLEIKNFFGFGCLKIYSKEVLFSIKISLRINFLKVIVLVKKIRN